MKYETHESGHKLLLFPLAVTVPDQRRTGRGEGEIMVGEEPKRQLGNGAGGLGCKGRKTEAAERERGDRPTRKGYTNERRKHKGPDLELGSAISVGRLE